MSNVTQETEHRTMFKRHAGVFSDVTFERIFQERKWGIQEHDSATWFRILAEEFGEIAKAMNDGTGTKSTADLNEALSNLREEIVQTIAVGVAWLEDWDRRDMFTPWEGDAFDDDEPFTDY